MKIVIPSEKLAAAVNKHLMPGLLRRLREEEMEKKKETKGA